MSKGNKKMSTNAELNLDHIQIDTTSLYREELITDLKVGSLQCLIPVHTDGTDDQSRPRRFVGQTQIMSQAGPLPIQAPIEATTIVEAIEKFPDAVKASVENLVNEAKEYQRQEASRIVVPGQEQAGRGVVIP